MAQPTEPKTVMVYQDENGKEPFTDWLNGLRDQKGRRAILKRIGRLELGLYGDCEPVGEGVLELRIFLGPGYRVYFGEDGDNIVVLLSGGDKGSQDRDIKTAKEFWKEYKDHG
ncbi:MAG TPA: type II toxin-antitoxin system RelE/ParE family toxin [Alphaproteobacteria bacterium]|nr:type II toxin-antitoxin system RelE/ParE family toxin [Alphaproteobacteria bacterium]USO05731.1 MAG: type II toxin-antitoxin system RelE/ParE family toxin [Rhodospirillales bacterium]HOO82863.1 type II toxin-antitoxin system RelE/ParE family toxin [Alphaproteobacteria bacterium]